jgi:hypothetical protein
MGIKFLDILKRIFFLHKKHESVFLKGERFTQLHMWEYLILLLCNLSGISKIEILK